MLNEPVILDELITHSPYQYFDDAELCPPCILKYIVLEREAVR